MRHNGKPTPAPPDIRQRLPLGAWVAIGTLALAVRFFYLWEIHDAPGFTRLVGDGVVYDDWARALAAGDWLGQGIFYQAPLYPYFLGVLYAVFGHNLLAVRIVQCILGALACALLGAAGSRLFCRTIGVFSGILLAVYPTAFFADGLIQKSSLDIFFVAIDPKSSSALANLATALGGAGQDDEAIAVWKQLIAIAPEPERAILEQRLSEYRHRADAQQRAP